MRRFSDAFIPPSGHFVNGEYVKPLSQERALLRNPANNEALTEVILGNAQDIDRAVGAAREAFDRGPWARMSAKERSRRLSRFASRIRERAETLGTIESLNVGKLLGECISHETPRAADNIEFFAGLLLQQRSEAFWNEVDFLGKPLQTLSLAKRAPAGVAALIVPWNSPLLLSTWKVGPCLAAGNTCVLKPSPWAPLSVLHLGELAREAGIPPGVLNIVPGAAEAGEALVRHPGVDRISFTGSVAVGKVIQQANAATRLAPVSLELGGKAPSIVFADADFEFTARGVARGIFRSQGQSCVAGSRLLVEESIYQNFLKHLVALTGNLRIGDPLDPQSDLGPVITRDHLERIEGYIRAGCEEGASLLTGGHRPADPKLQSGNYLEPTIFDNVNPRMRIWREEIFGPVLVAAPFHSEADAVGLANDSPYGLSANIWTRNLERALTVADRLEAGTVWINSHFVRDLRTPFGGVKESGVGSEGGRYSMEFYTQSKTICIPYPREAK
ncbi:MAG: aldehyde dehydrogenase [Acidobacteria bacterium]|nr:aldehyde dehydrogenase [Acidobacteriota bacterium]